MQTIIDFKHDLDSGETIRIRALIEGTAKFKGFLQLERFGVTWDMSRLDAETHDKTLETFFDEIDLVGITEDNCEKMNHEEDICGDPYSFHGVSEKDFF